MPAPSFCWAPLFVEINWQMLTGFHKALKVVMVSGLRSVGLFRISGKASVFHRGLYEFPQRFGVCHVM